MASAGRGRDGWLGLVIGGLVVAIAVIGLILWSSGSPVTEKATGADIDLAVPTPRPPDTLPGLPPVEPPGVPSPNPPAAPIG